MPVHDTRKSALKKGQKTLVSDPKKLFEMQQQYLEETSSFTEAFDPRSCKWYKDEKQENLEHMYKSLALLHTKRAPALDVKKSIYSIAYLAEHKQRACDCEVVFPGYIAEIVLMTVGLGSSKGNEWRTRLLQVVRMSRNQMLRVCTTVKYCLEENHYYVVPSSNVEYFFPFTGLVPMQWEYLQHIMGIVQDVFAGDDEVVSLCKAIVTMEKKSTGA